MPNNPKLKEVSMQVSYAGMVCIVRWKITNAPKRWVPPSSSNCKHPDSGIRFEELWGEVSFRCNDQDDDAYEFAEFQTVIKELDRIRTKEDSGAKLDIPGWQGCFTIGSEIPFVYTL